MEPTRQVIRATVLGMVLGAFSMLLVLVTVHKHNWFALWILVLMAAVFVGQTIRTYRRSPEK